LQAVPAVRREKAPETTEPSPAASGWRRLAKPPVLACTLAVAATLIATAISELARNIVAYAQHGEVMMRSEDTTHTKGIVIIARDSGPGIRSIDDVLRDGYSTSGGFGLGLPGVRRLMDEFVIESELRRGTTVTVKKWLK